MSTQTEPFIFQGDHGDRPAPGHVMLWSQWDNKPLAVINEDGKYHGAIVITDTPTDRSGDAIRAARDYLTDAENAMSDLGHLQSELRAALVEFDRSWALDSTERTDTLLERLRGVLAGV